MPGSGGRQVASKDVSRRITRIVGVPVAGDAVTA
jgi:hypothetical protein